MNAGATEPDRDGASWSGTRRTTTLVNLEMGRKFAKRFSASLAM